LQSLEKLKESMSKSAESSDEMVVDEAIVTSGTKTSSVHFSGSLKNFFELQPNSLK
jgi:hypothetical protein